MSGIKTNKLEPTQAKQILTEVKSRLQLTLQSPVNLLPGQPLLASVVPNVPQIDVSELVNGIINLAWLEKDVLHKDVKALSIPSPDTANASDLNGDKLLTQLEPDLKKQPFPIPAIQYGMSKITLSNFSLPISPVAFTAPDISDTPSVEETPGLAAQLAGTITLPNLSVNIKTEWIIEDKDGATLTNGKDLVALNGLTSPSVSILLPPAFRELRMDTLANPGGTTYCLSAKVTLSINDVHISTTLGPIPFLQLPVLVPTVVALFSEPNFTVTEKSAVLILVPKHSTLTSAAPLFAQLRKLETLLDALSSIAGIAGFLLGVRELTSLTEHPRLRFVAADGIPDLSDILLKRKPWYDIFGEDETLNDQVSSLFVFGLPGTQVRFYNASKYKTTHGFYEITLKNSADITIRPDSPLPDYFVAIRSFPTATDRAVDPALNDAPPETFPAGRISLELDTDGEPNIWDEVLTSVEFAKSWFEKHVNDEIENPQIITELICAQKDPLHPEPPLSSTNR